jgi:hypothetical protein
MSKNFIINTRQLELLYEQTNTQSLNLEKYSCIPNLFRLPTDTYIKKGYNLLFLKAALGIISRESDFGGSKRYSVLSPIKYLLGKLGVDTSVGPGQIKPTTAKDLGLSIEDINSASGSIEGIYKILQRNYSLALKEGYSDSPSTNLKDGTGNSALDMAILAFNTGGEKIFKYCKTSSPNIAKNCNLAGKTLEIDVDKNIQPNAYTPLNVQQYSDKTKGKSKLVVYNQPLTNYIPNYKTMRADGVNISTHGYVKEVSKKMKELNCF